MTPTPLLPSDERASGLRWITRRPVARALLTVLVALTAAAGLAACDPPVGLTIDGPAALFPEFSRDVYDYVNRCDPARPTPMNIDAPEGTTVSINGSDPRTGTFQVPVNQKVGSKVTITLRTGDNATTHYLRCLPADFPQWTTTRSGEPQALGYVTNLKAFYGTGYPTVFDNRGVPVWWTAKNDSLLLNPLPDGTLGQLDAASNRFTATRLDGTQAASLPLPDGYAGDLHDLQLLSNGNYLAVGNRNLPCDLSSWGLDGPQTCTDHTLFELSPTAEVVWSWDAAAHIAPPETPAVWQQQQKATPPFGGFDPLHYNSIDAVPGGFVVSFRHLDAIVMVDRASGNITWKLGGIPTPASLTVVGDEYNGPSGQHDARLDGNVLSLFDNGTNGIGPARHDRSTSYALDLARRTATLVRDTRDEVSPSAFCCGSSRVLPGGNVVTGWGGSSKITENAPDGTRVFELDAGSFVYRALPLIPGRFSIEQLRAGMDAQYGAGRL
jgi:hypothetical protein